MYQRTQPSEHKSVSRLALQSTTRHALSFVLSVAINRYVINWTRCLILQQQNTTFVNCTFVTGFAILQFHSEYPPKSMQRERSKNERRPHTLRSHGITLARTHLHDWILLILLVGIVVVLNKIHPFHRFVGRDMMSDLKFPLKSDTVPSWSVPIYTILLPILVFLLFYLRRRDVYDLHHAILGVMFSVIITGVLTDAIKDAVGRPRPDFFWRCFPDGKDAYDDHWGNVICHGDKILIKTGYESFPSGHTSWSFAGLGSLSLYLSGKIKAFDRKGHIAKLCVVFVPLLLACQVGISRVSDYRHHWQDVFVGGLLGLVVATFCYLQFFPPPYHINGWRTYAYLRVLEELRPNTANERRCDVGVENDPNERNDYTLMGSSSPNNSRTIREI